MHCHIVPRDASSHGNELQIVKLEGTARQLKKQQVFLLES